MAELSNEEKLKNYKLRNEQRLQAGVLLKKFMDESKTEGFNEEQIANSLANAQKVSDLLNTTLAYSFEELPYKENYTQALKDNYFLDNDVDFDEQKDMTLNELIEKDFEYFNVLDGSIVAGGYELTKLPFADEAAKNSMRTRLNTYMNTRATGDGSRAFGEQAKGVLTGVGFDFAATGGVGTLAKVAGSKFLGLNALKKFLGPRASIAATGATISAVSDVERQALEVQSGLKEEINPMQTVASAGLGAVIPVAAQPIGKLVGPVGRAITHPVQSIAKVTQKLGGGKNAATTQAVSELGDSIKTVGGMTEGSVSLSGSIRKLVEDTDLKFNDGFNNANIKIGIPSIRRLYDDYIGLTKPTDGPIPKPKYKIDKDGNQVLVEQTPKKVPGLANLPILERIMAKVENGEMTPALGLRQMKQAITNEFNAAKKGTSKRYDSNDADALFEYRKTIIAAEEAAAHRSSSADGAAYMKTKKDYQEWLKLKDDPMGKKILAAANEDGAAGQLIIDITEGRMSWAKYNKFMNQLDFFENPAIKAQIKGSVQRGVSENLLADNGKLLTKLLKNPTGIETLKKLFNSSDNIKYFGAIEDLAKKMGGSSEGPRSHLVHNLMVARLGEGLTKSKTFGPSIGIGLVETAINSKYFRTRMAHAWRNNKGRLDTGTRNMLEKKLGFSRVEVNQLQDAMWGMTGAGFMFGGLSEIEAIADPVERRMEEIKAGYSW